jgi:hypothetical protein
MRLHYCTKRLVHHGGEARYHFHLFLEAERRFWATVRRAMYRYAPR